MHSGLVQAVIAGVSAGSACSICGASVNSAFLSSYIITHRRIAAPVFSFLAGKTAMTAALCGLSAYFGRKILNDSGLAGRMDIYLIAQCLVLAIAVFLTVRWLYCEYRYWGTCHAGGRCCAGAAPSETSGGAIALFVSGIACGATPCGPLLMMLSQAAGSKLWEAVASGIAFSVTGFLSPVIFWLVVSRLLAKRMHQEIAGWIKWFQLGCYVLLAVISLYTIIRYKS